MSDLMDWPKLLSSARMDGNNFGGARPVVDDSIIHAHQKDSDRVLFSSCFRRLQGKTQVYVFPQTDYVRNRLTHTLEVMSVGRLLAASIVRRLAADKHSFFSMQTKNFGYDITDIIEIVSTACLAHDIGNPPFGHIGEYAIRSWFADANVQASRPKLKSLMDQPDGQGYDFELFDGNAQGFRVLTKLQGWGPSKGGLRLTAASLGASVKYPNCAKKLIKQGKYGYYDAEKSIFAKLSEELGLHDRGDGIYAKHPLSFIAEAADDIAYLTSDIEDAHKFGMVDFKAASTVLSEAAKKIPTFDNVAYDSIDSEEDKIKFLRSAAAVAMIKLCSDAFIDREEEILRGNLDRSLMSVSDAGGCESKIRKLCSEKVYYNSKKVKAEAGAYEVVRLILSVFSEAIEDHLAGKVEASRLTRSQNLLRLIDPAEKMESSHTPYQCYLHLVDYVSGMTDKYAMDIFDTLTGRRLSAGF